jgi:hypothetical protein
MELSNSALYEEIVEIGNQPSVDINYRWSLEILTENGTVPVQTVYSVTTERNYTADFSESVIVEFAMLTGDYLEDLLPAKDSLEAILTRIPVRATIDEDVTDGKRLSRRFLANLEQTENPAVATGGSGAITKEEANRKDMVKLVLQLRNKAVNDYRLVEVGGIYRDVTVEELIKLLLMRNVNVAGGSKLPTASERFLAGDIENVVGVDIVKPTNGTRYQHIVIEPGVRLLDIPSYLQKHYGVYDTGIGYYLQNGVWYVYPLYDITRFNKTLRTVTVANVPENRMSGADKTFLEREGRVSIISTGEVKHADTSDIQQLNLGNGYRLAKSRNMIDRFSVTSRNITTVNREDNMVEGIIEQRKDSRTIAFFAEDRISDNTFKENAKLAKRVGSDIILTWENSKPDLIRPGMPIKILYVQGLEVRSLVGVVKGSTSMSNTVNPGLLANKFNTTTIIEAFIAREG